MAPTTDDPGTVIQAWVPTSIAEAVRLRALAERRSISAVIRNAVEDRLTTSQPPKATYRGPEA